MFVTVKLPSERTDIFNFGATMYRLTTFRHPPTILADGAELSLDAKAFQLEQSAAQIATTALVLLNGLIVGSLVVAIFLVLIQLLNEAVLW